MNKFNNPNLTANAKMLRKNMTKEERYLWYDFLKDLPYTINRQKVLGRYIADFYCAELRLVIELDGSQHYYESGQEYDKQRDEYLAENGIKVLRFSNLDVQQNFSGVCMEIMKHLEAGEKPSPRGGK